jgi:hypothetical protein
LLSSIASRHDEVEVGQHLLDAVAVADQTAFR